MSQVKPMRVETLIEEYETAVFSSGHGSDVGHIVKLTDGGVTPACERVVDLRLVEAEYFARRRNVRICQNCKSISGAESLEQLVALDGPFVTREGGEQE